MLLCPAFCYALGEILIIECDMIRTSCSRKRLPLVSKTSLSSSSFSREGDTGATVAKTREDHSVVGQDDPGPLVETH